VQNGGVTDLFLIGGQGAAGQGGADNSRGGKLGGAGGHWLWWGGGTGVCWALGRA